METKKIKIGIIADDFTGASDAASFLEKSGATTIMYNAVPSHFQYQCDAVVVALKTRSVEPEEAIVETKKAVDFLKKINCERIYFKYCSTFDSTPNGNIGIVADFLMEYLMEDYTILCPSLPVNGRIVKEGVLYVNGIPLSESPLKDHPLNPMWDSYIPELMKNQSKYPCLVMNRENLLRETWIQQIEEYKRKYEKFYIIPDYETAQDGQLISEKFQSLSVLTGGSGLLAHVLQNKAVYQDKKIIHHTNYQRSVILCGSCSMVTKRQIKHYQEQQEVSYAVDAEKLMDGSLTMQDVLNYIERQSKTVLVYSDAIEYDMQELKKKDSFFKASMHIEKLMGELSCALLQKGFNRIVVGGGETSGAVTKSLGFDGFCIGKSVDPGVPELIPLKNEAVTLVLKSGNFGAEDFFVKVAGGEVSE